MSLETLLEAAKYVEYRSEAKARGEEPHDYHTFSKLCSASKDGVYPDIDQIPQKRQQTLSNSSHSSEEIKEKRRSINSVNRDSLLSHEHSGTGTREVHNKLEKNRRAHLKECFEALKKQLPNMDDRKTSNLSILRGAIRFIQVLKRKEREYEHDMERLAREKIAFQQRLSVLKKDLASQLDHVDVNNFIQEDDNETTTTASAHTKQVTSGAQLSAASKESATPPTQFGQEPLAATNKTSLTSSVPSTLPSPSVANPENCTAQTARVFSTGNLHAMTGIFAAPHTMQVISQPSGIKVITTPNSSIMASNSSVQHISVNHHQHGQIHVLTPSSSNASYISSITATSAKTFAADSLMQVASNAAKNISKSHLVSPLTLVSPQAMVGISSGSVGKNIPNNADLISSGTSSSLNLSQNAVKGNSTQPTSMAIAVKNNISSSNVPASCAAHSNMIATLHVSKSHPQMMQPTLPSSIITQGGSQINNGTHHGVASGLKPITSNPVRSLPHIAGVAHVAHVVSQSPITAPVGQIVTPGNHVSAVTPLVGSVSVVSHTAAVHQQSLGKVLAAPVLKSVNQINPIPIIQQQFLQQVSVGSSNQPIVKPVVVVSVPSVVPAGNISPMTPTSLVSMSEQPSVVRGSAQK